MAAAFDLYALSDELGENQLVRSKHGAAQVVRYKNCPRIVVAFPAGNSGALVEFGPSDLRILSAEVVELFRTDGDGHGLRLRLTFSGRNVEPTRVLPGSIREIRTRLLSDSDGSATVSRYRDAFEKLPAALRTRLATGGFSPDRAGEALGPAWRPARENGREILTVERPEFFGHRTYRARLSLPDCALLDAQGLVITLRDERSLELEVTTPYRGLTPIPDEDLFNDAYASRCADPAGPLAGLPRSERLLLERARESLKFLATGEKLLAGGYRFLTYFGRDTLLSSRMLLPIVGRPVIEAACSSVLDRLSPAGEVAHEEALGNQAILEHMRAFADHVDSLRFDEAVREIERFDQPVMDYQMVDDDFLLAPLVRDILLSRDDMSALLVGAGNRVHKLGLNLEYVLLQTLSGLKDGKGIPIRSQWTGNWRDSNEGLGMGRYPGDINRFLVPAALEALQEILEHPLMAEVGLRRAISEGEEFPLLRRAVRDRGWLGELQERWAAVAGKYSVHLAPEVLRARIADFLSEASPAERRYFGALEAGPDCTLSGFSSGRCAPPVERGLDFSALSLDDSHRPVEVVHSDSVFALFNRPLPVRDLVEHLTLFSLPFPLGLWTEAGPLVANPVLCRTPELAALLDPGGYHGEVIWGWVAGMLHLGLARQRAWIGSDPAGPAADLLSTMEERLRECLSRNAQIAASELWSWEVDEHGLSSVAFGSRAAHTEESNAVQLWNTVWLAVYAE